MEIAYRKLHADGKKSWADWNKAEPNSSDIDPDILHFFHDCRDQPWFPSGGRCLELGCGTGPIIRYFAHGGFSGTGIEISETAIGMAREQSLGLDIEFTAADVTAPEGYGRNSYDLVVDGNCLHCIFYQKDRSQFLNNVHSSLEKGGIFILLTMVSPTDEKGFAQKNPGLIIHEKVIYAPLKDAAVFSGCIQLEGKTYLPTRFLEPWQDMVLALEKHGFKIELIRLNLNYSRSPNGFLCVACSV